MESDTQFKLLIVDDSPLVSPRVRSMLEGFEPAIIVGESYNAEEALELMQDVVPDALLLDLNLPGKNGIRMLMEVKSLYPEVKVIVFTNHAEAYYRDLCMELGADYFLDKSSEFDLLPATLRELVQEPVYTC